MKCKQLHQGQAALSKINEKQHITCQSQRKFHTKHKITQLQQIDTESTFSTSPISFPSHHNHNP